VDGDALLAGWPGFECLLSPPRNLGVKPNASLVGSFMGINNAEAKVNGVKLFHAWVQKTFWDKKASVLVAAVSDSTPSSTSPMPRRCSFIPPWHGGGGRCQRPQGPSIFPNAALGVRLKLQPDPTLYAQVAVTDGVPGDPANPRGTHILLQSGDGVMIIAEIGYRPGEAHHVDERGGRGAAAVLTRARSARPWRPLARSRRNEKKR